jgi:hypothetical protein
MKFIETKVHGYLDYLMGLLLVASPWIFDFARGGAETLVPVLIGIGMIIYSLLTDYELGVSPQLSMRTHLTLDMLSGALLAVSPWLFGFDEYVWQPHLVFGLLEIGAAAFTKTHPQAERRHRDHTAHAHH